MQVFGRTAALCLFEAIILLSCLLLHALLDEEMDSRTRIALFCIEYAGNTLADIRHQR